MERKKKWGLLQELEAFLGLGNGGSPNLAFRGSKMRAIAGDSLNEVVLGLCSTLDMNTIIRYLAHVYFYF